jgi:hypothetical protein
LTENSPTKCIKLLLAVVKFLLKSLLLHVARL